MIIITDDSCSGFLPAPAVDANVEPDVLWPVQEIRLSRIDRLN